MKRKLRRRGGEEEEKCSLLSYSCLLEDRSHETWSERIKGKKKMKRIPRRINAESKEESEEQEEEERVKSWSEQTYDASLWTSFSHLTKNPFLRLLLLLVSLTEVLPLVPSCFHPVSSLHPWIIGITLKLKTEKKRVKRKIVTSKSSNAHHLFETFCLKKKKKKIREKHVSFMTCLSLLDFVRHQIQQKQQYLSWETKQRNSCVFTSKCHFLFSCDHKKKHHVILCRLRRNLRTTGSKRGWNLQPSTSFSLSFPDQLSSSRKREATHDWTAKTTSRFSYNSYSRSPGVRSD